MGRLLGLIVALMDPPGHLLHMLQERPRQLPLARLNVRKQKLRLGGDGYFHSTWEYLIQLQQLLQRLLLLRGKGFSQDAAVSNVMNLKGIFPQFDLAVRRLYLLPVYDPVCLPIPLLQLITQNQKISQRMKIRRQRRQRKRRKLSYSRNSV